MSVGSDATTADTPSEYVSNVSDAEVPIIPADQARMRRISLRQSSVESAGRSASLINL